MMAQNEVVAVGIDVAKDKVDACIRASIMRQSWPSTAQGHRKRAMSDGLNAGKNAQRMLPQPRNCSQCGESASLTSILRTRDGKSFRLYKCASCGGLAWVLEEQ